MAERIDPAADVYARALHGAAVDAGRVRRGRSPTCASSCEALAANLLVLRALINPELPGRGQEAHHRRR